MGNERFAIVVIADIHFEMGTLAFLHIVVCFWVFDYCSIFLWRRAQPHVGKHNSTSVANIFPNVSGFIQCSELVEVVFWAVGDNSQRQAIGYYRFKIKQLELKTWGWFNRWNFVWYISVDMNTSNFVA